MRIHRVCRVGLCACLLTAAPALAEEQPTVTIQGHGGYAAFLDESPIDHGYVGGAVLFDVTPRLRVGPEITWMRGPGADRDLFVTGTLTWDVIDPQRFPRVVPTLIVSGGTGRFIGSWEGAITAGVGLRVRVTPRVWVAPEFRVGWEPHYRIGVSVGYRLGATR